MWPSVKSFTGCSDFASVLVPEGNRWLAHTVYIQGCKNRRVNELFAKCGRGSGKPTGMEPGGRRERFLPSPGGRTAYSGPYKPPSSSLRLLPSPTLLSFPGAAHRWNPLEASRQRWGEAAQASRKAGDPDGKHRARTPPAGRAQLTLGFCWPWCN